MNFQDLLATLRSPPTWDSSYLGPPPSEWLERTRPFMDDAADLLEAYHARLLEQDALIASLQQDQQAMISTLQDASRDQQLLISTLQDRLMDQKAQLAHWKRYGKGCVCRCSCHG